MKPTVHIVGPRDNRIPGAFDVTSRSKTWARELSPFFLGPVDLYDGHTALNVENAWQFSKLYAEHVDAGGRPTNAYWKWARKGWSDTWAHRYPMGKGARPLCSLWDGEQLDYIQARKRIYVPLYASAVVKTDAYKRLKLEARRGNSVALWDYDGYFHRAMDMTLEDVINDPTRKMGHAFVLAMLLTGKLKKGRRSPILQKDEQ